MEPDAGCHFCGKELGFELSAFQIMPKLFYPMLLLVSSLIAIFGVKGGDDK